MDELQAIVSLYGNYTEGSELSIEHLLVLNSVRVSHVLREKIEYKVKITFVEFKPSIGVRPTVESECLLREAYLLCRRMHHTPRIGVIAYFRCRSIPEQKGSYSKDDFALL